MPYQDSFHPSQPVLVQSWGLFARLVLAMVPVIVAVVVALLFGSGILSLPFRGTHDRLASTALCDPALAPCVLVEYLEYYENVPAPYDQLVGVGAVTVGGQLSHCKDGLCKPWRV